MFYNNGKNISLDDLLKGLSRAYLVDCSISQDIDSFLRYLQDAVSREIKDYENRGCDRDGIYDGLYIVDLGYELAILALYNKLEIAGIKLIRDIKPALLRKSEKVYLSDFLANDLNDKEKKEKNKKKPVPLPFFKNSLQSYTAYDELRLINNAIKHQGCVSEELSKISKNWGNSGDELKPEMIEDAYLRLKKEVPKFLSDLFEKVYEIRDDSDVVS